MEQKNKTDGYSIPTIKAVRGEVIYEHPDYCEEKEYHATIYVEAWLDSSKGTRYRYRLALEGAVLVLEPQYPSTLSMGLSDTHAHFVALVEAVMDLKRRVFVSDEHPTGLVGCNLKIVSSSGEFLAELKHRISEGSDYFPTLIDPLRQTVRIETILIRKQDSEVLRTSADYVIEEASVSHA